MSNPQRTGPRPGDYAEEDRGYVTPCWIWQKGRNTQGYGYCTVNYKPLRAHRFYYEHFVGQIPEGLDLDHLCRQPSCVNPAHMEPVTEAENTRRGSSAKLTMRDVEQIRWRLSNGESNASIARSFNVSGQLICDIKKGRKWVAR